jgi:hypothetical protein
MVNVAQKDVTHGLGGQYVNIIHMSAIIVSDSGSTRFTFEGYGPPAHQSIPGYLQATSTIVRLNRNSTGSWADGAWGDPFTSTSNNRGKLKIEYAPA